MKLSPWMRLLRVPNLLTVPGDPLAGILIATAGVWPEGFAPFAPLLASLCLYASGLVMNDICDLDEDRIERPHRPLPANEISVSSARFAATILLLAGMGFAVLAGGRAGIIGLLLAGAVAIYNTRAKHIRVIGPFMMGLCRGLSFLLGAAAFLRRGVADPVLLLGGFESVLLYVAMTTHLARTETEEKPPHHAAWAPFVVLFLTIAMTACRVRPWEGSLWVFAIAAITAVLCSTRAAMGMRERKRVVPWHIGILITALLPLQALWIATTGRWDIAMVVLLIVPLNHLLKRLAHSS